MSLLLTIGWLGYSSVNQVAKLTEDLYNHPFAVSTAVLRIQSDVLGMHRAIKEIVLAESIDDIQRQQKFLTETEAKVLSDFNMVQERFLGEPALVQTALQSFQEWRPIREEVIQLAATGRKQKALMLAQVSGNQRVEAIETVLSRCAILLGIKRRRSARMQNKSVTKHCCISLFHSASQCWCRA